ncbi:hypothetical protein C0J50_16535 [Silurus asotus]|uniref:TERF1-interacting nuclear factor 2 N-terminal domain-containing protein n=1 Tax=Silurus asotus TaxID=30991 RepID=A0AAD5AVX2_SILAS|nr:hypothetical protein C0J50_16535 [Silurus asotus]
MGLTLILQTHYYVVCSVSIGSLQCEDLSELVRTCPPEMNIHDVGGGTLSMEETSTEFQFLGPPPWLEGDRSSLTLKDPCSIRVTAAESWMIIQARDIKHFERVMEFLHITHTLLPQLVTPIKHMKIMFGLKTLVIMWMLWDEQSIESIKDKTEKFFPDSLSQYRRSSHRHIDLMQKAQRDFRNFVQLLTGSPEMRKNYIQNLMEEQYGERYIIKLEERLLHYLEKLNKALPQPTYIDQVKPFEGFSMGSHMDHKSAETHSKQQKVALAEGPVFGTLCVRSSLEAVEEDWLSQGSSQSSWLNKNQSLVKPRLKMKHVLEHTDKPNSQMTEIRFAKEKKAEDDVAEHLCSRHGKRMKSFIQECSEELRMQDSETSLAQVECTPSTPLPPPLHCIPHSPNSASSPHDSSSTNISLSSPPEAFSYLSVNEERQLVPSQISPAQDHYSTPCSCQKSNIPLSASPECSIKRIAFSPPCSVQPSQTSSSSTNISPFPENKLSSTEQECSPLLFYSKSCSESSYHQPGSISSSSSSSSSSFSAAPAVVLNPSQNDAQVSLDSDEILKTRSALMGKLRLSLETQAFLLVCKWLQPQVKLYRLSQHECSQATLPNCALEQSSDEEEEEYASFDVNLLYSDSESDTQGSDDSDYVPSKRRRYK